jgi:hypothetical protein
MKLFFTTTALLCAVIFVNAQTNSKKNSNDTVKIVLRSSKMIYNESTPISLSSTFEITSQTIRWYSEFPKTKGFEDLDIKGKTVTYSVSKSSIGQNSNEYFAKEDNKDTFVKVFFDKIRSVVIIQDLGVSKAKISFLLTDKN